MRMLPPVLSGVLRIELSYIPVNNMIIVIMPNI